jgi:hypothetical protein
MSISPPPPPGFSQPPTSYQQMVNTKPAAVAFRRPRMWVPPMIMLDAFAAGYAIPWDLGNRPAEAFIRFVLPLIVTAAACGVAGFYSYRTVRGWQMWAWIAFAISAAALLNLLLFPVMVVPTFVFIVFLLATIGLFFTALLGAESLKPFHLGGVHR